MYPNTKVQSCSPISCKCGFTLTEVLISVAVTSFLVIGVLGFYITNYKIGYVNQERNLINADFRSLTGKLIADGRQSNYFMIYNSIAAADHASASDRITDGGAGNLLLFVTTTGGGSTFNADRITRIVYYFRATQTGDSDELVSLQRYEQAVNTSAGTPLESLIVDASVLLSADELVEESRGLADGHLFYNFWGRSVMVNGQIYHGNNAKRVTETYNFTVSPRG